MKTGRLFEILYILIDRKNISAGELAKRFEVSVRTIYRDIDALCAAGIPIFTQKGKGGGIRILDGFIFDKSILSENEQNEILVGLQSLKAAQYPDIDDALSKFASLFNKEQINWIEIDFSYWGSREDEKNKFNHIRNAILKKQVIKFKYFNSYGQESNRTLEPVRILFKSRNWYLYGYCRDKQDYRLFKLTRIADLTVSNEYFNRSFTGNIFTEQPKPKFNVTETVCKIEKVMSYRVLDEFHPKNITKNEDGSFTVKIKFPEDEWLYSYLLSYGCYIEVLEPPHLRDIIHNRLKEAVKKYEW